MDKLQFLGNCYGLFLNLYPKTYRDEYGEELQMVFNLTLDEAMKMGRVYIASVLLQELIGLPGAIIHEYLRERRKRKMTRKFASRFDFPQGSRTEFLAVMASFVIPVAVILFVRALIYFFGVVPANALWLNIIFAIFFFGSLLGMLGVGLAAGVPRWFLPYLGFMLSIINLFTHTLVFPPSWSGFSFLQQASRFIRGFVRQGTVWIGVIVLAILLVLIAALIPKFRPFYRRLKDDWTLLAFVIYGAVPLAIILTFDDYQGEQPYVLTANLILTIGGWFYLRTQLPWKRYLILFIGLALSMAVAALGKAIIYKYYWEGVRHFTWQSEMMSTVTLGVWMALFMLTTLVLILLPQAKNHSQISDGMM
ncbi:MAG: hypothetical protein C3F07_16220 [Anaerolineales bacterium]|nr:MAG: hypothetical protein C3F07_16220 [Anaerolineales bacterium]